MIIAIDGYSSCGKSTIAKELAKRLGITYVDSGAMYRAVTFKVLQSETDIEDDEAMQALLDDIHITFEWINGQNQTFLNGTNIELDIRSRAVSDFVSPVATIEAVRTKLVRIQRAMGKRGKGVVMDGRDIGTVVYPHADYKFFITADVEVRTMRRYKELIAMGKPLLYEEVKANLIKRDKIDSSRAISPLKQAEDAIVIDNSNLDPDQQIALILNYINV